MNEALTPGEVNAFVADLYPSSYADGTRCIELGEGMAMVRWPFDQSTLRPGGYISGPRMFALADSALWFAAFTVIGLEAMAVTSEMSIRFLRPAQNGDLVARANLNSMSTRRLVGTIELWVDGSPDRLVAVAQGSYARPRRGPADDLWDVRSQPGWMCAQKIDQTRLNSMKPPAAQDGAG